MRRAEPTPLPIPFTAVDSIIDWIDGNVPTRTHLAVPQYLTTVTMPAERPDGVDVFESIERIAPNGLFAIRTQPRGRRPAPAKTVLFFVMSNDLHVGPAREWVELSRRIAAAGSQAVRWVPAGQGLSGPISRDRWRRVYSKVDIADSVAVARQACHEAGELQLVGICSGRGTPLRPSAMSARSRRSLSTCRCGIGASPPPCCRSGAFGRKR